MKLQIGETIRQLRLRDGRTQEDLAEALGISPQAVSRWEKGGAYPDMEAVPAIANYFGVTIDMLFGYEGDREQKIDALTERIYAMNWENNGRDVSMDACIQLARESLAQYPGNEKLMLALASVLYNAGYVRYGEHHLTDGDGYDILDAERHRTYGEWQEAIRLYEKLLTSMPEGELRQKAVRELVQLYLNTGDSDKALDIVAGLPSLQDCRELMRPLTCDGKERARLQGEAVLAAVHCTSGLLIGGVLANGSHLTPAEAVCTVKNAIAMYDLVCTDGNYGVYHSSLACLHLYLSFHCWRADDRDGAFAALDRALEHARICDAMRRNGQVEVAYTAPLLRLVTEKRDVRSEAGIAAELPEDWPWWCDTGNQAVKAEMKKDPRWDDWVKRCGESKK